MVLTPLEYADHTAGALQFAADAFAESPSAAQQSFAHKLATWASNARARADALRHPEQPDLFGAAA